MFEDRLERLKARALLREASDRCSPQGRMVELEGRQLINFSSNDYLGLADHPALKAAAIKAVERFGTGAGASRLLSGGCTLHSELELKISRFKGTDAALLFNSGYAANTGVIPAIAGDGDALFSDELNHASIIDGCRLSRAKTYVYRHRDTSHLETLLEESSARNKIVVTDTVFSMDGDIAPLRKIYGLCERSGAVLYLDDAHGTGVLGDGRGALAHCGLAPEPFVIQMGTFSKALGSFGAFVTGDSGAMQWFMNSARSFIFSTALPPAVVAASIAAVDMVENDTSAVERLWANRGELLQGLGELGLETGGTETPIIPVMVEKVEDALALSDRLFQQGIYAPAIRPPTVKKPRLRLTVTASHSEEDIKALLQALRLHSR